MTPVGIRELRQRGSELLRLVGPETRSRSPIVAVRLPFSVPSPAAVPSTNSEQPGTSPPPPGSSTISPIRWSSPLGSLGRPGCWPGCRAMSAERAIDVDSSAIVKLVVSEPESTALRRYLRRRRPLVTSALARTEVARALLPLGHPAVARGAEVLQALEVVRLTDRVLRTAGAMLSFELRSLDAIRLATAVQLRDDLTRVFT